MSVTIKLSFPAGRYHATPWGRHVNEGVAEWPPSPWRLLRALVAVWRRTCPDTEEASIKRILGTLSEPPHFRLPPHRVAHTRHYMPLNTKLARDRKGGGTTLIFDSFVSVPRDSALFIGWPDRELTESDSQVLSRLLANLPSLGRAESWVDAKLTNENVAYEIRPATREDSNPVTVLCADPSTAFTDEHYPKHDPKKLAKGQIKPADYLFDCPKWHLCLDTETIHAQRWSMVPGSRWVRYVRPPEIRLNRTRNVPNSAPRATVATFLLDAPVLPLLKDTVQVADCFRWALMSRFNSSCNGRPEANEYLRAGDGRYASPTFAGKTNDGSRLPGHDHAHYLPIADSVDGRFVRQVMVYAPKGFTPLEVAALKRLRIVKFENSECRTQLIALQNAVSLDRCMAGPATTWVSSTPFIAHRHAKTRGSKRDIPANPHDPRGSFLALSAREICERRGLPGLEDVTTVEAAKGKLPFYEFRRARRKVGDDAYSRIAGYLRLTFAEPISGPLCLGYNCHFGMGQFTAVDE